MNEKMKDKLGQVFVDTENNQLTFTDQRFYRTDGGNYVPSVTTILNCYPKGPEFYEWLKKNGEDSDNIRDAAGFDGSLVHQLCERYSQGEVVSILSADGVIQYSTRQWSMFERYVEFIQKFKPKILMAEFNIISPKLGYAGTIDMLAEINGKRYIVDIKTSGAIHKTYWLQLSAYKKLFEEKYKETVDGYCILWLNAKTRTEGKGDAMQGKGWQMCFPDMPDEHYATLFTHTISLYNEEYKDSKPRNLTYQLTYKL